MDFVVWTITIFHRPPRNKIPKRYVHIGASTKQLIFANIFAHFSLNGKYCTKYADKTPWNFVKPGNCSNIKMRSYPGIGSHYVDKKVSRLSDVNTGNIFIWEDGLYIDRLVVVVNGRDLFKPVMIQIQWWPTVINWHLLGTELRWLEGRGIPCH